MSRSLRIERDEVHGVLFKVAWNGGGEIPDELKGHYTNPTAAQGAIDVWLAKNPEREVKVEEKPAAPVKE